MRRAALIALLALLPLPSSVRPTPADQTAAVEHVIVIALDNYHLDDIEAHMPHLRDVLRAGALATGTHHTVLPTKTAPDYSSIASGQYPDRHGVINNAFLTPGRLPEFRVGFAYWENLAAASPSPFLSDPPWLAFNRAGWDVGAVGFEGLVLETREEVNAHLGRPPDSRLSDEERDQYWGLAVHHQDGSSSFGTAEIPALKDEFPRGWERGWGGPPRKHAAITLRMTTLLQAAGIPITFTFVENTHARCDPKAPCRFDLKQGEFDDLLQDDDTAFGRFFDDLAALEITPANTLFVITSDEGDHYLEDFAQPVNIDDLRPAITGSNALFYSDDEDRTADGLAARAGVQFVASRSAMRGLHIGPDDDPRTPAFMAFSDLDSTFRFDTRRISFRWNHGNVDPDITDIWLGLRGPGIRPGPLTGFSDHTDIVPTIRAILGLPNRGDTDGTAILAALERGDRGLGTLREAFKQLNAPLGRFGRALLGISTAGVRGGSDARAEADQWIADLAAERDALVGVMRAVLDGNRPSNGDLLHDLLEEAAELLAEAEAGNP